MKKQFVGAGNYYDKGKKKKPYSIQTERNNTCPYINRCNLMEIDFEKCASVFQKCIVYQRYERAGKCFIRSGLERFLSKWGKNWKHGKNKTKSI